MTAHAFVESDWAMDGVKVFAYLDRDEHTTSVVQWGALAVTKVPAATAPPDNAALRLPQDLARALYEALSAYFGGNVVDARMLRKDYDAERARVDLFIKLAIHG